MWEEKMKTDKPHENVKKNGNLRKSPDQGGRKAKRDGARKTFFQSSCINRRRVTRGGERKRGGCWRGTFGGRRIVNTGKERKVSQKFYKIICISSEKTGMCLTAQGGKKKSSGRRRRKG